MQKQCHLDDQHAVQHICFLHVAVAWLSNVGDRRRISLLVPAGLNSTLNMFLEQLISIGVPFHYISVRQTIQTDLSVDSIVVLLLKAVILQQDMPVTASSTWRIIKAKMPRKWKTRIRKHG